jgi:hypothetical protein
LFLNANPITSDGLNYVTSMRSLRILDLGGTKCDTTGISKLRNLSNLKSLSLNNNRFIDDKAAEVVSSMDNLKELNMTRTKVTGKGIAYLDRLEKLSNLSLGNLRLQDKDIGSLKNFSNLTSLYLGHNRITIPLMTLPSIPFCKCRVCSI